MAAEYHLPEAEIVRLVLKVGLPLLEATLEAQAGIIREVLWYRQRKTLDARLD